MGMKTRRQEKILELIEKHDVETQDDLMEKLRCEGFSVTQATISRDIRDLKLTKVTTERGVYKYISAASRTDVSAVRLNSSIIGSITGVDYALNDLVIKTIPSMAPAIAAGIDGMATHEILGCVAGDDCVIAITRTEDDAALLCERIRELIKTT